MPKWSNQAAEKLEAEGGGGFILRVKLGTKRPAPKGVSLGRSIQGPIDPARKYSVPHPCAFLLAQGWET
jgi:hypothetical protein